MFANAGESVWIILPGVSENDVPEGTKLEECRR